MYLAYQKLLFLLIKNAHKSGRKRQTAQMCRGYGRKFHQKGNLKRDKIERGTLLG